MSKKKLNKFQVKMLMGLVASRALIANVGWKKGDSGSVESGGFCATGAIDYAVPHNPSDTGSSNSVAVKDSIRKFLRAQMPKNCKWTSIVGFNDASKTTKRQVLALFDRAIKKMVA